jgi:hypothetical protein
MGRFRSGDRFLKKGDQALFGMAVKIKTGKPVEVIDQDGDRDSRGQC